MPMSYRARVISSKKPEQAYRAFCFVESSWPCSDEGAAPFRIMVLSWRSNRYYFPSSTRPQPVTKRSFGGRVIASGRQDEPNSFNTRNDREVCLRETLVGPALGSCRNYGYSDARLDSVSCAAEANAPRVPQDNDEHKRRCRDQPRVRGTTQNRGISAGSVLTDRGTDHRLAKWLKHGGESGTNSLENLVSLT